VASVPIEFDPPRIMDGIETVQIEHADDHVSAMSASVGPCAREIFKQSLIIGQAD
jgi:hypothetical protein